MATIAAIGGAAVLFALFGLMQRSYRGQRVSSCACFGGTGTCATCPHELESGES